MHLLAPRRPKWGIYYADRELARLLDDRRLAVVRAFTRTEAEQIAERTVPHSFPDAGLIAVPLRRAA